MNAIPSQHLRQQLPERLRLAGSNADHDNPPSDRTQNLYTHYLVF